MNDTRTRYATPVFRHPARLVATILVVDAIIVAAVVAVVQVVAVWVVAG